MIADDLDALDEQQLRQALRSAQQALTGAQRTIAFKQAIIDKITHENALLKRLKFPAKSEAFTAEQKSLLDETLDTDLAAVAAEIEQLQPQPKTGGDKQQPKRQALPAHLPRRDVRHEPEATDCRCGTPMQRIGEDVSEKLDYQPGMFTVERADRILYAALARGLSFKVGGGRVLTLCPPLTISDAEFSAALDLLEAAFTDATG